MLVCVWEWPVFNVIKWSAQIPSNCYRANYVTTSNSRFCKYSFSQLAVALWVHCPHLMRQAGVFTSVGTTRGQGIIRDVAVVATFFWHSQRFYPWFSYFSTFCNPNGYAGFTLVILSISIFWLVIIWASSFRLTQVLQLYLLNRPRKISFSQMPCCRSPFYSLLFLCICNWIYGHCYTHAHEWVYSPLVDRWTCMKISDGKENKNIRNYLLALCMQFLKMPIRACWLWGEKGCRIAAVPWKLSLHLHCIV